MGFVTVFSRLLFFPLSYEAAKWLWVELGKASIFIPPDKQGKLYNLVCTGTVHASVYNEHIHTC